MSRNWTQAQLDAYQKTGMSAIALPPARPSLRLPKPLLENGLEREYWEITRNDPGWVWVKPKPITLWMNSGQKYRPDFFGQRVGGRMTVHETKGNLFRPQDVARFKQAIMEYPMITFVLVRKTAAGFTYETFNPHSK